MGRLVDIPPGAPDELTVSVGDVVRFTAAGGTLRRGRSVEAVGTFTDAVVGTDGRVYTPEGPPTSVLYRAIAPGPATIEVREALDPWGSPSDAQTIRINVEP